MNSTRRPRSRFPKVSSELRVLAQEILQTFRSLCQQIGTKVNLTDTYVEITP